MIAVLSRAVRTSSDERRFSHSVVRCLADPFFPIAFFLRNVMALRKEAPFNRLAPRMQRRLLLRILRERSAIFLEVREWISKREGGLGVLKAGNEKPLPGGPDDYCSRCGWCCEIASGMPVFPENSAVPLKWRNIFGDGLGKGHRFCAFLWEAREAGGSLCSIHPWRSIPCRTFERDECEFLQGEPDFSDPSVEDSILQTGKWLIDLMDGR